VTGKKNRIQESGDRSQEIMTAVCADSFFWILDSVAPGFFSPETEMPAST